MLPKLSLLMIIWLSLVASQTQPTLQCLKTNPLVGLTVDILAANTLAKLGTAFVVDDCSLQLNGLVLQSSLPVELLRQNRITLTFDDVFVNSNVALSNTFSQFFSLKSGERFNDGDQFILVDRTFILATINLRIPRTTTTTTTTTATTTTTTTATTTTARPSASASATPSPSSGASSGNGKVYNPDKLVLVTLNSNLNYPNPPTTQTVSFYINNQESPVLTLVRGNSYTFSIMAGPAHPFYLTTSIEGGKKLFPESTEQIFLGNSTTFGTLDRPLLVPFTPTADMPNEFYYQCWNHTRMGWKVNLIESKDVEPNNIPPLVSRSRRVEAGWIGVVVAMVFAAVVL